MCRIRDAGAVRLRPRPGLASPWRRCGPHPVVRRGADHDRQRLAPPGGLDLQQRGRAARGAVPNPVQPHRRAWRALRHHAATEGVCPRCGNRAARWIFNPFGDGTAPEFAGRQSRRRVLGKRRGPAHPRGRRTAAICTRREDGETRRVIRPERQRESEGGARRPRAATVRVVQHTGRDLSGSAHHRDAPVGRTRGQPRLATFARSTSARVACAGCSRPSPHRANSATTRGPPTPGRTSAAPTRGAASPSTRRGAWCSCRPARRPSTSGAATATARTCLPTRCWRSRRPRANGCGTTSSCTTICGIATCHRRRCWSP